MHASALLAVVILSVCPSVRPSVIRVLCDKTTQRIANILIPYELRAITRSFLTPTVGGFDGPFRLKFALKVTQPL